MYKNTAFFSDKGTYCICVVFALYKSMAYYLFAYFIVVC